MEVSSQPHSPAYLLSGKHPGTRQIGGCVGPRAGEVGFWEEKNFLSVLILIREINRRW